MGGEPIRNICRDTQIETPDIPRGAGPLGARTYESRIDVPHFASSAQRRVFLRGEVHIDADAVCNTYIWAGRAIVAYSAKTPHMADVRRSVIRRV